MPDCNDSDCHLSREEKQLSVWDADGNTVGVDPCIAGLVRLLNRAGIRTVASCCGHGFRPGNIVFEDGRELIIARSFSEARRIDRLFQQDINGPPYP